MRPTRETLRELYEDRRLTTRAIGERYGVAHISVCRWLRRYGIPARLSGTGLRTRGVEPPGRDELHHLVHVEHLSYEQIAARYGVDFTAVPYWLDKHGIARPDCWVTRRKGVTPPALDPAVVLSLYESGEPLRLIAGRLGVSQWMLRQFCRRNGIKVRPDGFDGGKRYVADDGTGVRSLYELRAANWFHAHGMPYTYEPKLPFNRRLKADFLANGWYVEIWGVERSPEYEAGRKRKIALYVRYDLPLIGLKPHHFSGEGLRTLERRLSLIASGPRGSSGSPHGIQLRLF